MKRSHTSAFIIILLNILDSRCITTTLMKECGQAICMPACAITGCGCSMTNWLFRNCWARHYQG